MLFTSYSFLFFCAIVFCVYYTIPKKGQGRFLLAASYVFYLAAGPKFLLYIVFTTVTTFLIGRKLSGLKEV